VEIHASKTIIVAETAQYVHTTSMVTLSAKMDKITLELAVPYASIIMTVMESVQSVLEMHIATETAQFVLQCVIPIKIVVIVALFVLEMPCVAEHQTSVWQCVKRTMIVVSAVPSVLEMHFAMGQVISVEQYVHRIVNVVGVVLPVAVMLPAVDHILHERSVLIINCLNRR